MNYCVALDEKTINKLSRYCKDHSISRSAVIRLAVNDFFIRLDGAKA